MTVNSEESEPSLGERTHQISLFIKVILVLKSIKIERMIFRMDVCMYVALTGDHILGRISTKFGIADGCGMGIMTVCRYHGPVITLFG